MTCGHMASPVCSMVASRVHQSYVEDEVGRLNLRWTEKAAFVARAGTSMPRRG